jgi:hypothetical protein
MTAVPKSPTTTKKKAVELLAYSVRIFDTKPVDVVAEPTFIHIYVSKKDSPYIPKVLCNIELLFVTMLIADLTS